MGRSRTPKYAVVIPGVTPMAWWIKPQPGGIAGNGKPTAENLARFVAQYIRSLEPGGVNYHVSQSLGHVPYPDYAKIVVNGSWTVVAEWKAPAFMAVGQSG